MNFNRIYNRVLRLLYKNTATEKAASNPLIALNFLLIIFQVLYTLARFDYLNPQIPLWFTQPWGEAQLAEKSNIFVIPLISSISLVVGLVVIFLFRNIFIRYIKEVILASVSVSNIILTISLLAIIFSASVPFKPFFNPTYLYLFFIFISGFIVVYLIFPYFISWAKQNDLVTNPSLHEHPGMALQKPSVRGGGFVYAVIFTLLGMNFVGIQKDFYGLFAATLMLGILGLADDFQNTNQKSKLTALENPGLRLFLLFCSVLVLVASGVIIKYIGNPLGGIINLEGIRYVSGIFTLVFVVWVLNLLSWSNGIDGQYNGIVGIASLFICVLALRFSPYSEFQWQVAVLAALSAGIAFGFTRYTWFPSQIMWGFGATAAGLVLSGLSIMINTKILISVLILLIPFLDAFVTIVRRIIQGKNPLKGDRGHFHHLLMERGWSIPKISLLYWLTTFVFGVLALLSSEKYLIQVTLTLAGLVAFIIILMNMKSIKSQEG